MDYLTKAIEADSGHTNTCHKPVSVQINLTQNQAAISFAAFKDESMMAANKPDNGASSQVPVDITDSPAVVALITELLTLVSTDIAPEGSRVVNPLKEGVVSE